MRKFIDTSIMAGLLVVTAVIAAVMAFHGKATWLEAVSFVTGAACVWLTVKESVWNFPVSLANVATFSVVYFNVRLYADAGLQVVYFVLTLIGWYLWLWGGKHHTALRISRTGALEWAWVLGALLVLTGGLWQLLHYVGGSSSFWDALTTSISLGAQWLLNRKRLENWILWIVGDVIYIPLYLYKELYLTSILYAVFLAMATMGLMQWLVTWRKQRAFAIEPMPAEAAA